MVLGGLESAELALGVSELELGVLELGLLLVDLGVIPAFMDGLEIALSSGKGLNLIPTGSADWALCPPVPWWGRGGLEFLSPSTLEVGLLVVV
jgi:hypothetical protein